MSGFHVGHYSGAPSSLVDQLRQSEERVVDVNIFVSRSLDDGNVVTLEFLPIDQPLEFPDEDLVGLVTLGGRQCQRLFGLEDVVHDLCTDLNLSLDAAVRHQGNVEEDEEAVDDETPVRHDPLLVLPLQGELILADVHKFLRRVEPGGRAPLRVGLRLSRCAEGLEGGVVVKLRLFDDLECQYQSNQLQWVYCAILHYTLA